MCRISTKSTKSTLSTWASWSSWLNTDEWAVQSLLMDFEVHSSIVYTDFADNGQTIFGGV